MPTRRPRTYYLDRGICPNCKCREVAIGRASCATCIDAVNKWAQENRVRKNLYNKQRYESLKAQGLCVECMMHTNSAMVYCETCMRRKAAYRAMHKPLHSRNRWNRR